MLGVNAIRRQFCDGEQMNDNSHSVGITMPNWAIAIALVAICVFMIISLIIGRSFEVANYKFGFTKCDESKNDELNDKVASLTKELKNCNESKNIDNPSEKCPSKSEQEFVGKWITAAPANNCFSVCKENNLFAVSSGQGPRGYPFYVCRQNTGDHRPGFNIDSNDESTNHCLGEESSNPDRRFMTDKYQCLCTTKKVPEV